MDAIERGRIEHDMVGWGRKFICVVRKLQDSTLHGRKNVQGQYVTV